MYKNISNSNFYTKYLGLYFKNFINTFKGKVSTLYSKKINKGKNSDPLKFLPISICTGIIIFKDKERKLLCYKASNKQLEKVMTDLDNQIRNLEFKYQGKLRRQPINHGIRGTRLYIEFNINQKNVNTEELIKRAIQTFEAGKTKYNFRVVSQEKNEEDDMFSFKLDYEVASGELANAKNKGSLYLRGAKGKVYDNYAFSIEKQNDFSELDTNVILAVYEDAFQPRVDNKNEKLGKKDAGLKGYLQGGGVGDSNNNKSSSTDNDPMSILHKYGVSVFMPGEKSKSELDWDYLAGYENVKRAIEDTILLGLTHGEIYDQITAGTRMKNETNRPKAVLFEGPPGCGKTTSAKIIANQVNIPLIYMPIESIMSKYYGESETRFAEIFEATKSLGRSIIFIDEVDALASSREGGIHEASRRILSTLLRKIDSFESDGEVLVICATNRSKDLDPALLSRLDITIRFDLPDERMRSLIFQRYAKQLSQPNLESLGKLSQDLSGRDIADICKDAERRWAAMYIRKERKDLLPDVETYKDCLSQRLGQMKNVNRQFELSDKPYWLKH